MADPSRRPAAGDTEAGSDRESTTGLPRWVKVMGIVAAALVLLIVAVLLIGGEHGPGRHAPSGNSGAGKPATTVVADLMPFGGGR